jgi:hypothetical protein
MRHPRNLHNLVAADRSLVKRPSTDPDGLPPSLFIKPSKTRETAVSVLWEISVEGALPR